jgi:hypothetical protein
MRPSNGADAEHLIIAGLTTSSAIGLACALPWGLRTITPMIIAD